MVKTTKKRSIAEKFNLWLMRTFKFHIAIDYPIRSSARFVKKHFGDKRIKILEIGVFEGINSLALYKELNVDLMHLMDMWGDYNEYNEGELDVYYQRAKKRLHPISHVAKLIKGDSRKLHTSLEENFYDYIYIDGDHSYEGAKADMDNYWSKLKVGGVMGGHDISNNGKATCRVSKAFCEFVVEKDLEPWIHGSDWWVIKDK